MKASNGSSYRLEYERSSIRCPRDMEWLSEQLKLHNLKAYSPDISVTDPKNRKSANELKDWCRYDGLYSVCKLWSVSTKQFVPKVNLLGGKSIQSRPTQNQS